MSSVCPSDEWIEEGMGVGVGVGVSRPADVPLDPCALRVLGPDDEFMPAELLDALVRRAVAAVELVAGIDPAALDAGGVDRLAAGIERLRRQVDAAGVALTDHVDAANPFREQGFFTARAWLRHRLQLSSPEAYRRVRVARMHRRLSHWANAEAAGLVGVAQSEVMGKIAANPRIDDQRLREGSWDLLGDAIDLPFDEFERRARRWEALVDPTGAAASAERIRNSRDAMILPRDGGGWELHARLDELDGAELREILAHYIDREWRADWDEVRTRIGDAPSVHDLRRTEPQRRADALMALGRAAASAAADPTRACPTLNVLVDEATLESTVCGTPIDPHRYADVVCRTASGRDLHPADAANLAWWAHIRRVVLDSANVIIDFGRRRRLFQHGAREAVMLLEEHCVWIGCDQPAAWCQADHSVGWAAHGATVPRNGAPLCGRHNRFKERGYRVHRDGAGEWHTIDPDGNEIT
jgi:hypothetical protein